MNSVYFFPFSSMNNAHDSMEHDVAHDLVLVEATGITHDGSEVPGTLVLMPRGEERTNRNSAIVGSTEKYRQGFDLIFGQN